MAHVGRVDKTTPEQEPAMSNVRKILQLALVAGAAGLALPAASNTAAALPLAGLQSAVPRDGETAARVEQARWVCGPYRCFWQPNYWGPGPRWGWGGGPGWGRGQRWGWRGGGWNRW
jgi:hypothetical protein